METKPSNVNIASMLSYLPLMQVVFLLVEKENQDVRFHAWQSTVFWVLFFTLFLAMKILIYILTSIAVFLGLIFGLFIPVLGLVAIVILLVCMIKAYQGERWKIPYLGDYAEQRLKL